MTGCKRDPNTTVLQLHGFINQLEEDLQVMAIMYNCLKEQGSKWDVVKGMYKVGTSVTPLQGLNPMPMPVKQKS